MDPNYDYLYSASINGVKSWFDLDPYVHFGAHLISWLASFATLDFQAIALSLIVNAVWSSIGVGIFFLLRREGMSTFICFLSTLTLALCPAAAESSLGNVGNVKWPMIILAIVLTSSKQIVRSPYLASLYLFVTGLTNPLTAIVFLPMLMNLLRCEAHERKKFIPIILGLTSSLLIQVITVGTSGLTTGSGGSKTYIPWPGMGLFWWGGLIGPPALCLIVLSIYLMFKVKAVSPLTIRITVTGLLLSISSYFYGGIADRYFVAPMVLSWIASITLLSDILRSTRHRYQTVFTVLAAIAFAVPVVHWFDASWYLTAGPTWSSEISKAKLNCRNNSQSASLNIGTSTYELSCSYILNE